jgi:hypothetical protein
MFSEKTSDETGVRFEYSPQKSLRCLAQETRILKFPACTSSELLKLKPLKTTVVDELQPFDFYNWILHNGDIDPYLIFFSNKACFTYMGK